MIATLEPLSPLDHWRHRLGGRRRLAPPRPLAALGYLANGPVIDGLLEVEKLTLILLYDARTHPGHYALRLAGYSGSRVPWGVRFGGRENCRFVKDLSLQPVAGARCAARSCPYQTAVPGARAGSRTRTSRAVSPAASPPRPSSAQALGWISTVGRQPPHGRWPGTGRLRPAHRQITPTPAATSAPRSWWLGDFSAGLGQPPLAAGGRDFRGSNALSAAAGLSFTSSARRSDRLPGSRGIQLPGKPLPSTPQTASRTPTAVRACHRLMPARQASHSFPFPVRNCKGEPS